MPPKRATSQFKVEFETDGDLNLELTTHFSTLRIINSTKTIWPIFYLYFHTDNQLFIEKNIYGSSDILCRIIITREDGEDEKPPILFNLLYVEAKIDLPPKKEENTPYTAQEDIQRRTVVLTCLSKPSYLMMTTFVNKLWEEPTNLTPIDMVKELMATAGIETKIIDDGFNPDTVQQMLIPPMTLRAAVDYINQNYAIYSGPMFRYCNYDGRFLMWDLKKNYDNYRDCPMVTMHKSPSHFDTPNQFNIINDLAITEPDQFVIYENTESIHHANANLIRYGYDNIYITHPHEDIAFHIKKNADEIVLDYGMWDMNPDMKYHNDLKARKLYFNDMVGFETGDGYSGLYSENMITQDMATSFMNPSSIRIELYRNVRFPMLMKVGEILVLQPYSDFEQLTGTNYAGAYIIQDSEVVLTRQQRGKQEDNINCITTVTCVRTSQSKD